MDGSLSLKDAHAATIVIEDAILSIISPADVTVHMEPVEMPKISPKKQKTGAKI